MGVNAHMKSFKKNKTNIKGKKKGAHHILDFYGCDPYQINSLEFWQKELTQATERAGLEILHSHFHEFDPHGITGVILLSTSHLSIHSWPEYGYVACDIFSCSRDKETTLAVKYIKQKIIHKKCINTKIKRGYVTMEYLMSPVYSTGKKEKITIKEKLAEVDSGLQKIIVIDTHKFGKSMVIDGLVQNSEKDHETYDKALLHKLKKTDRSILILGGGDGYVAETALKINPKLNITIVDLDSYVIDLAKTYFDQKVFKNKKVKVVIGDALNFLHSYTGGKRFDGIISDLTDNPVGTRGAKKGQINFYKKIIELSIQNLNEDGWMSFQAGASKIKGRYIDSVKILSKLISDRFEKGERLDVLIPSFSEKNAFLYANKSKK